MRMAVRSKWWPLPSHSPLPIRKSKFSLPTVVTVKMLYCAPESEPTPDTVWRKRWQVPLSERIADRVQWHSILDNLG